MIQEFVRRSPFSFQQNMRFNKNELIAVASLPSNKFEKEGVLLITEKQEGFFRRTEGEFQLKSRDLSIYIDSQGACEWKFLHGRGVGAVSSHPILLFCNFVFLIFFHQFL